jgi:O-acetylhomoserine/O-acetylserine sulfhydrylase-like pyridoxal-dependent enzyme
MVTSNKECVMKDATLALHHGFASDPTTKAVAVPIYQTVAYEFESAQHGADCSIWRCRATSTPAS